MGDNWRNWDIRRQVLLLYKHNHKPPGKEVIGQYLHVYYSLWKHGGIKIDLKSIYHNYNWKHS